MPPAGRRDVLVALLAFASARCDAASAIWLTAIQPFTGGDWDAGLSMRIGAQIVLEEVNRNPALLPGYELKVVWQDGLCLKSAGTELFHQNLFDKTYKAFAPGRNLSELDADGDGTITTADTAPMFEVWGADRVSPDPVGFLGPGCSGAAMDTAALASAARFPMVSASASRPALSDRSTYPHFFRTIMPDSSFNGAWVSMAKALGQVSMSCVIGETSNWASMGSILKQQVDLQNMTLVGSDLHGEVGEGFRGMQVPTDSKEQAAVAARGLIKARQRMVIVLMFHPRARLVMCEASKLGVANAVYMPFGWFPMGWWSINDVDCAREAMAKQAVGFISANMNLWRSDLDMGLSCSPSMTARQFQQEWYGRHGLAVGNMSKVAHGFSPDAYATAMADSVCMYAKTLHKLLVEDGVPMEELTQRTPQGFARVFESLSNTDFEGVQGRVKFVPGEADLKGSVILQQFQREADGSGDRLVDVALYTSPTMTYPWDVDLVFPWGDTVGITTTGPSRVLANFRECDRALNFATNECLDCPEKMEYIAFAGACVCAPGHFTNGSLCIECPAGRKQHLPGASSCEPCPPGYVQGATGQQICEPCGVGTYQDVPGGSECRRCGADKLHPKMWSTMRKVSRGNGSVAVYSQAATGPGDCTCDEGAWSHAGECRGCIEGMVCRGMGDVLIAPHYFAPAHRPDFTFKCYGSDAARCPGGLPGECAEGRDVSSVPCARCATGMAPDSRGVCVPCGGGSMAIFVICILAVVVSMIGFYGFIDTSTPVATSKSVLLVGIAGSQLIWLFQQLSVLSSISLDWPPPFDSILSFVSIFAFNLDYLSIPCVAGQIDPMSAYFARAFMVLVFVVVMAIIHCASVVLFHKGDFRDRMPSLVGSVGAIFSGFFIAIVSSMLAPFMCRSHPNGLSTTHDYNDVICFGGDRDGRHAAMVGGAIGAMLIPLSFLAGVVWAVRKLPHVISTGDTGFLVTWRFLFFRFRPGYQWFAVVFLLRNLLSALVQAINSPTIQIILLHTLFLPLFGLSIKVMPWAALGANILDITITMFLCMLLLLCGLCVGETDTVALGMICSAAVIAVFVVVIATIAYGVVQRLTISKKHFAYFICHHKAGAGNLARLLKMNLKEKTDGKKNVFVDSDDLADLAMLFGYVSSDTETLVVVCSTQILCRHWCVGEITTAHASGTRVIKAELPDFVWPDQAFIDDYATVVPDVISLSQYGIATDTVRKALLWLEQQPTCVCPPLVSSESVGCLVAFVLQSKALAQGHRGIMEAMSSHPSKAQTVILADMSASESACAALVVQRLLGRLMMDMPEIFEDCVLGSATRQCCLLCSRGIFGCPAVVCGVASAAERALAVLPVVVEWGFSFPTKESLTEAADSAHPLLASAGMSMAPGSFAYVVGRIFEEIAIEVNPQDTEEVLEVRARAVQARLARGVRPLDASAAPAAVESYN